jgi:hypothetical protein
VIGRALKKNLGSDSRYEVVDKAVSRKTTESMKR